MKAKLFFFFDNIDYMLVDFSNTIVGILNDVY